MVEARGWEALPVSTQGTDWGSETEGRDTKERLVMGSLIHGLQGQGPLSVEGLGGRRKE